MIEVTLTAEQEALKDKQYKAVRRMCADFDNLELRAVLNREIDAIAEELELQLGTDAPCWHTDQVLWGEYSDFYKERNGFRPRMPSTRAEVRAWIDTMDVYDSTTDSFVPQQ